MRCLNNILEDFFYSYAGYVQRYVYIFLFAPVIITFVFSTGFYFVRKNTWNDTEYVFSPTNGYSIYERRTFDEQFPLVQDNYVPGQSFELKHFFFIIITGKGDKNANLLRNDIFDELIKLNQFVQNDLTVDGYDGVSNIKYKNICLSNENLCFENDHLRMLRYRNEVEDQLNEKITFPISRFSYNKLTVYLAGLLGNVTFDDEDGRLIEIGALRLVYFMKQEPTRYHFYSIQFRDVLQQYLLTEYKSNLIEVTFGNEQSLTEGVQENTMKYMPAISVTVTLVLIFSYLCSFMFYQTDDGLYVDWVRSKPLLALVGTIEPGLAVFSTVGFLLWCGCPYNDIIIIMPFLVFAIAVDDMFIMISAWHNTRLTDPPEKRFAEALSEAAVAISITSLTDIIAFSVGTWNPFPAMQMFCYYTATAMLFELIYQCTFYSAALFLIGRAESKGLHCLTWKKAKSVEDSKTMFQKCFCIGTIMRNTNQSNDDMDDPIERTKMTHFEHQQTTDHKLSIVQTVFRKYYGPILLKPATKFFVAFLFVIYLMLSIWGTFLMPSGLQPDKLVDKDHYVHKYLLSDSYLKNGAPLQILFNKPPDLSNYDERNKIFLMLSRLENTNYTMDDRYTVFWMKEYEKFLNESKADFRDYSSNGIKKWINSTASRTYWDSCIRWTEDVQYPNDMRAFRFSIGMKNYYGQSQQKDALVFVRSLLSEYPEYNITCYHYLSPFVDQYLMIYSTTVRNTIVSLGIMVVLAVLLIPHPVCGLFMIVSVLSIDVGVTGFLYWWNVNMDCISMITIIIATGFAVDLSAHVSYAYVRAEGTANARAMKALETLGWPVVQGVMATFLGVLVMGTVDAYMFRVFFKTIVLVILFGLLHSLVFLPVALTVFVPKTLDLCRNKNDLRRRLNKKDVSISFDDTEKCQEKFVIETIETDQHK